MCSLIAKGSQRAQNSLSREKTRCPVLARLYSPWGPELKSQRAQIGLTSQPKPKMPETLTVTTFHQPDTKHRGFKGLKPGSSTTMAFPRQLCVQSRVFSLGGFSSQTNRLEAIFQKSRDFRPADSRSELSAATWRSIINRCKSSEKSSVLTAV
jgi:hypothetical protein